MSQMLSVASRVSFSSVLAKIMFFVVVAAATSVNAASPNVIVIYGDASVMATSVVTEASG